jgi:hypothetical protein
MAFTYTEDLSIGRDFVRFHTGDVVSGESFLSDAVITSLIATTGSNEAAVIAAIRHIIARLSTPNFRADWLQIDNEAARRGYEKFLAEKKKELGLGGLVSGVIHPYRADSAATEEPDFTGGRPSYYSEDDLCLP